MISIVTTLYKSESFVKPFYNKIVNAIKSLNEDKYEIIFVDDGSPDNSGDQCKDLIDKDKTCFLKSFSKLFLLK